MEKFGELVQKEKQTLEPFFDLNAAMDRGGTGSVKSPNNISALRSSFSSETSPISSKQVSPSPVPIQTPTLISQPLAPTSISQNTSLSFSTLNVPFQSSGSSADFANSLPSSNVSSPLSSTLNPSPMSSLNANSSFSFQSPALNPTNTMSYPSQSSQNLMNTETSFDFASQFSQFYQPVKQPPATPLLPSFQSSSSQNIDFSSFLSSPTPSSTPSLGNNITGVSLPQQSKQQTSLPSKESNNLIDFL